MARGSSLYLWWSCAALCCVATVTSTNSTLCVSCSYVYTGHAVGKECISAPYQGLHSNRSCLQGCITTAVYTSNYGRLNSLTRGCRIEEAGEPDPDKVECEAPGGGPRCREICFTDLCNDGDGDLYQRRDRPTGDNSNRVVSPGLLWLLIGAAVLVMLL